MKLDRTMLGFVALFLVTGCSRGPVLYPARGEVTTTHSILAVMGKSMCTLNEVIPCARLDFIPEQEGACMRATGMADFSGRFALETPGHGQGATAGDYKVVVTVNKAYHKRPVPPEYLNAETTPLRVTLPSGGDEALKINLAREIEDNRANASLLGRLEEMQKK